MHALDGGGARDAARLQPIEEFDGGARIGAAGVRIADIGGEEFKEAIRRALAARGDKGRSAFGEGNKLVHRSVNPSIKAASGASSLLKLATIAASIALGSMRSSASGCPARAASKVR